MDIMHAPKRNRRGFTLIELSIVLLVLSLIAGGLLTALTQNTRIRKEKELQAKLSAIESGLIRFRRQYNRLPCPADATLKITDNKFGIEASNSGSCDGNPSANFNDSSNTSAGVVPVRAIGVPDDYMFDPWGGRFTYAVDIRMTAPSAFMNYNVADTTIGSIKVLDGADVAVTERAIAVVVSHGANGHGAYQVSGQRKSAGSTNAHELLNCHCNEMAISADFTNEFVIQPPGVASANSTNSFDDVVRYWLRSQIYSANDIGMR
jgi:prepilin-type N-terminal cleavage/methylation domain-containing protein